MRAAIVRDYHNVNEALGKGRGVNTLLIFILIFFSLTDGETFIPPVYQHLFRANNGNEILSGCIPEC